MGVEPKAQKFLDQVAQAGGHCHPFAIAKGCPGGLDVRRVGAGRQIRRRYRRSNCPRRPLLRRFFDS